MLKAKWFVVRFLSQQIHNLNITANCHMLSQQKATDLLNLVTTNLLQNVTIESFYQNHTCVITFLRRFGWAFCRLGARELSSLKPQLDAKGVRLIGIGLEELGLEEFQKGEFFAGGEYLSTRVIHFWNCIDSWPV